MQETLEREREAVARREMAKVAEQSKRYNGAHSNFDDQNYLALIQQSQDSYDTQKPAPPSHTNN
jgi:hypothetical protein